MITPEDYYTNHFRTKQMLEWNELTPNQQRQIKDSIGFASHNAGLAFAAFAVAVSEAIADMEETIKRKLNRRT